MIRMGWDGMGLGRARGTFRLDVPSLEGRPRGGSGRGRMIGKMDLREKDERDEFLESECDEQEGCHPDGRRESKSDGRQTDRMVSSSSSSSPRSSFPLLSPPQTKPVIRVQYSLVSILLDPLAELLFPPGKRIPSVLNGVDDPRPLCGLCPRRLQSAVQELHVVPHRPHQPWSRSERRIDGLHRPLGYRGSEGDEEGRVRGSGWDDQGFG